MYTESYKQQVYKKWQERGSPWFSIDSTQDPSWEEKQIIIEMKKREAGIKSKPVNEIKHFNELLNLDNY